MRKPSFWELMFMGAFAYIPSKPLRYAVTTAAYVCVGYSLYKSNQELNKLCLQADAVLKDTEDFLQHRS